MSDDTRRAPGASVQEALARARRHARTSLSEGILAAQALLDALALLQAGAPAEASPALSRLSLWLERLAAGVAPGGSHDAALTRALADALDAEIERWELRARDDPDARAVLRAFLGVRELLWELGVRPASHAAEQEPAGAQERPRSRQPRRRRVQRVPVQG